MKLIRSDKGIYKIRINTEHGYRIINTQVKSRPEAIRIIRDAGVPQLERAARTMRLTNEVVNQLRFGKSVKVSAAVEQWDQHLTTYARSPKTTINKLTVVKAWSRDKHLSDTPSHVIKAQHIDSWINDRSKEDKAGTRGFKLSVLRSFFHFCATQQFILTDPTLDLHVRLDQLRHSQKEVTKQRPFTEAEFGKLMAHFESEQAELLFEHAALIARRGALEIEGRHTGGIDERLTINAAAESKLRFWRLATLIGRHSGLRLGDVCKLESESIDVTAGRLIVWTRKTHKRVSLPMPEVLRSALSAVPVNPDTPYLFPEQAATYSDVRKRCGLSVAFARLCAAAGAGDHGFHSLRHGYAAACRAAGIPTPHISERLGHSNQETTEGYL